MSKNTPSSFDNELIDSARGSLSYEDHQNLKAGNYEPALVIANKKRARLPWIAAIFAAVLTLLTLGSEFLGMAAEGGRSTIPIVLIANLPLCFMFTGMAISSLQKENDALRVELYRVMALAKSGEDSAAD